MMGWYHDGLGWGGWLVMTVAMVAFWALVIWAVVAIVGHTSGAATTPGTDAVRRDPMQILEERFARGEIDTEEYHARAAVLRHAGGDAPAEPSHRTTV